VAWRSARQREAARGSARQREAAAVARTWPAALMHFLAFFLFWASRMLCPVCKWRRRKKECAGGRVCGKAEGDKKTSLK